MFSRKKAFIILSSILVSILFSWKLLLAQPQISGVTGKPANGQSSIISGSGFGLKPQAAPWRWDSIDNGGMVNGTSINYYSGLSSGAIPDLHTKCPGYDCTKSTAYWNSNWGQYKVDTNPSDQRGVSTANLISQNGNTCSVNGYSGANNKIATTVPESWNEKYISYWVYPYATFTNQNVKFMRVWGGYSSYIYNYADQFDFTWSWTINPPPFFASHGEYYNGKWQSPYWYWNSGTGSFMRPAANEWERIEVYIKQETASSTSNDGRIIISQTVANRDGTYQRHTYDSGPNLNVDYFLADKTNWITFGNELSNCSGTNTGSLDMTTRLDDIYIDNTIARVELCDAPTWSASTHCEIQIPSSWSDSSITITGNQGSFSNMNGTYLYVVDANGIVSNGYPSSPYSPNPPKNLSAK